MANVSANIGANTQQAESSIGRLLASLRKLRQESSTGVGMKMFASDEVNKLSTALNQAIAAAGALNKLDLSQFDQSLRRSAELLKRNADNYLRAQQAMGNQGVAGRFAQQLGAGGNPLNPNFGQMFPGMQGAALQRQMDFYFKSMLRGTGMSGGMAGGGGARGGDRGGTTGQGGGSGRSEATENEGVFSGAGAGLLAGVGKLLGPLVAAIGVGKLASASLASARGNVEAEDTLMRMTRDTGAAAGKLADEFIAAGLKVGLSATEAMKTAQVFASAAQEIDRGKALTGATSAAGFARGYGLNINGTTETLGGLQRAGVMGSNEVVQNSFLMKMAQIIKDTGMTANADQVLSDLAQTVDRYISHDSATPDQNKLDAFTSLRAATYMTPGLSGQHGQNLLNRYDENMRSDGNDARNIMMAVALQANGIDNYYTQAAVQAEGANFDLSTLAGWKGAKGMTYGELAARQAHQTAIENAGPEPARGSQAWTDWDSQVKYYESNLLNEAIPGAHKPYELYQQRQVDRESMTRHQGDLKRYGLGMSDFKSTGGFKDVLDLLETDDQDGIRKIAKRYASELDITDEAQRNSREHLEQVINDSGSDPEAIKKATLQAMAKYGQHGTMATDDRTKDAMVDNALANTGKVFLSEWNKFLMIGAKGLDAFAEVSGDLVETLEESLMPSVMALSREAMNAAGYLKEIYRGDSEYSILEREGALDAQGNLLPSASPEQQARYARMQQRQQSSMAGTPGGPTVTAGVLPNGSPTTVDAAVAAGIGGDPKNYPKPGTRAWDDWVEGLEKDLKLPPGIMAGTENAETGHLANQEDKDAAVGTSGEIGRNQLMASVIADRGVKDPNDPHQNTIGAALHHAWGAQQLRKNNISPTAQRMAAAYNAGAGRVIGQKGNYTNKSYVDKVMRSVAKPEDANGDMAAAVNNAEVMDRAKDRVDLSQKNMCATYATTVGQEAGLDIPVIPGAQNAANYLEDKLGWQRYPLEEAKAGHLLVARDDDKKIPGADHVAWMQQDYDPNNPDTVQVVDNQNPLGGTRDVTGRPGPKQKTPPQYFLGPPESGGKAFKRFVDKHTPMPPANTGGQAAANIPPPPAPNITPTDVPADTGSPAGEATADTGAATPSAPTEAAATAPADTGAAQPDVPADTGTPPTVVASGKGGKLDTDVPSLASVAPTEKQQTPEEAAAQAAKDAEAKRQAKAAAVPKSREEVSRLAAKQKDDAPTTPTGAPKPATDARPLGFHGDGSGVNPENKAGDAAQRAQQGLPPAPDGTDARSQGWVANPVPAPGDMPVDADASKVVNASGNSSFSGTVDVNVHNHNSQGQRTESKSTTLKAGSGGTDNIPKGVVTIGTAPAAPQ